MRNSMYTQTFNFNLYTFKIKALAFPGCALKHNFLEKR